MSDSTRITDEQLSVVTGGTPDEIPGPVNGMCHMEKLTPTNCECCRNCSYKTSKGLNALGTHIIYECLVFHREFPVYKN